MNFLNRAAIQINRYKNDVAEEPQYLVGSAKRINKLWKDITTNTQFFQEQERDKLGLKDLPDIELRERLGFGFVPDTSVPIIALVRYFHNHKDHEVVTVGKKKSRWSGLTHALQALVGILIVCAVGGTALLAYIGIEVGEAAAELDRRADECVAIVKDGKLYSISRFGETVFVDRTGKLLLDPVAAAARHPKEIEAHNDPFRFCTIIDTGIGNGQATTK